MKRAYLKKNIKRFVDRYNKSVLFERYTSTADQADAPYRQRKRKYDAGTAVKCAIIELKNEDTVTPIGDAGLRQFDVCTGPDQLAVAFHPLDHDDPRVSVDPSLLVDRKDRVIIDGLTCKILRLNRHGDDGSGPLWYIFRCEEDLE